MDFSTWWWLCCCFGRSWTKAAAGAVVPFGGTARPAWPHVLLHREGFCSQLTKKSYRRNICLWRNHDSVQRDRNKVLLFPLKLIIKRVEFAAVNFIVFLQVVLVFSLPCLFLLDFWEDSVFAI